MNQNNGITYRKLPGISGQGLRNWGLFFLICGTVGISIFENVMVTDDSSMTLVTAGLALKLIHFCAIPVFAFLLVEGFLHTTSIKAYAIRLGTLALFTELPYNLATTGSVLGALSFQNGFHFDFAKFGLNPVFGLLLALALLYLMSRYPGKKMSNILIKLLLLVMGLVWAWMLRINYANALIVMAPALYFLRKKRMWQVFGGCLAMFLCCIFSPYYIGAPIAILLIHFYNDDPGDGNRYINYLAYPVILLAIGLVAKYAI